MTRTVEDEMRWVCPFCGEVAARETEHGVICYSKTCACGAICLAAPPWDSDEIIDDAINIFGVKTRAESRGFDALLLADVANSGVEVREGVLQTSVPGMPANWQLRHVWFRRDSGRETGNARS